MKIIAVATLKGGTGKTTTVFNLAGCLAQNYKVLLIDFCPHANLSQDVGIDITKQNNKSVKDIFTDYLDPKEVVVSAPVPEIPGLDIIPSNILMEETEMQLIIRQGRDYILHNYITANKEFFDRYDYIFCDTSPSMNCINRNAYYMADSIVLVTDVSKNGLTGIELFDYLWRKAAKDLRKEDNIRAIIINNGDIKISLTKELLEYCREDEDLSKLLVEPVIPQSVKIKETSLAHQPINVYFPGQRDHRIYREIIKNLENKGVL